MLKITENKSQLNIVVCIFLVCIFTILISLDYMFKLPRKVIVNVPKEPLETYQDLPGSVSVLVSDFY